MFDIAVIGSSPLLVLYALHEDSKGKRVCLIEKNASLGGAWALGQLGIGPSLGLYETTCHFIEWYKDGYEILGNLSGKPFLPLNPQPVKVYRSGRVTPYLSKAIIVTTLLRTVAYLGYNSGRMFWRLARGDIEGARHAKKGTHFAWQRLWFDLRFRVKSIHDYDCDREPEGGYAQWMAGILERLERSGVVVLKGIATKAKKQIGGGWLTSLSSQETVQSAKLVMGESTTVESLEGVALEGPSMTEYHHAIVSCDSSHTQIRNRYIHCVDDPYIHRVSFLGDAAEPDGGVRSCWLVQFRTADMSDERALQGLAHVSKRYPFLKGGADIRVEKRLDDRFFRSPVHAALNHVTEDDLVVLRTIGDLSRNVLYAKYFQSAFS